MSELQILMRMCTIAYLGTNCAGAVLAVNPVAQARHFKVSQRETRKWAGLSRGKTICPDLTSAKLGRIEKESYISRNKLGLRPVTVNVSVATFRLEYVDDYECGFSVLLEHARFDNFRSLNVMRMLNAETS